MPDEWNRYVELIAMGWLLLPALTLILFTAILVLLIARAELHVMSGRLATLAQAKQRGSHKARLQHPHVDLSRCIGCGTCVKACPEEGVLDLIHGQAVVIHGARCVGHGECAKACPVGAVDLTLGDLKSRRDIPTLTDELESQHAPGLFLAGEVTGYALIRTAVSHGKRIANEVGNRLAKTPRGSSEELDLCIIGAGPAGVAASLQAKARGLSFVTLEQEELGGTVSRYPRRKLIMTQPIELPLHGRLKQTNYSKEELMELWHELARKYELPIRTGQEFCGVESLGDHGFIVHTLTSQFRSRFLCLALGRRGTPKKLGILGESLPKVSYSLIDARSYEDRRVLVVGGGDSAVEAALGLAEQTGNNVSLSYRRPEFVRLKASNEARLEAAIKSGRVTCIMNSNVVQIGSSSVRLIVSEADQPATTLTLPNDEVFIMAGGKPPFQLLEQCGVSFDPSDRAASPPLVEQGTGLLKALTIALALAVATLAWTLAFSDYYWASRELRPLSDMHEVLRPSSPFGLTCGVLAVLLVIANMAYLLRRSWLRRLPGRLSSWMTAHVVTGILAMLVALMHAAMLPGTTVGGHGFAALCFLVVTGGIGRYFYSFLPRAANGNELAIEQINLHLERDAAEWDRLGPGFGSQARREIDELVTAGRKKGGFFLRILAILQARSEIKTTLTRLRAEGRRRGLGDTQIQRLAAMAQRAYRAALVTAHYEDLRALLNYWRFFHRWVALLMILLVAVHIYTALRYGSILP